MTTTPHETTTATGPADDPPRTAAGRTAFWDWLLRLDLRRSQDRWLGGVAAGLAHRLGVDPLLLRVAFVVVSLVGGAGLLLYAAAWLLLPDAGGRIEARCVVAGEVSAAAILALGMVALTALVPEPWSWAFAGPVISGGDVLALVVVGVVLAAAVALLPRVLGASADPPPAGAPDGSAGVDDARVDPAGTARTAAHRPAHRRPKLPAGLVSAVLGVALLAGAGAWLLLERPALRDRLGLAWVPDTADRLSTAGTLALALAVGAGVLGLGLVAAGLAGRRSDGLGFWAVTASLASVMIVSVPSGADVRAVGETTWRPTSAQVAERGFASWAGGTTLDLTGLPTGTGAAGDVVVPLRQGFGGVRVVVPAGARVEVRSQLGIGDVSASGPGWTTRGQRGGFLVDTTSAAGPASAATRIVLDVQGLVGDVDIERSAA